MRRAPTDDATLRDLWDEGMSIARVAKRLERTEATTYHRAQELKLPLGVPDGSEHLTRAAERTGYAVATLRHILEWAGVRPRAALSRPRKHAKKWFVHLHRTHIVEPLDVDDAIERWHATEPVERAARRRGFCGETLKRRLRDMGFVPPAGLKVHWRVTDEQVDAAFARPRYAKAPTTVATEGSVNT